jgi:Putative MetA-pathway of phenol degradation
MKYTMKESQMLKIIVGATFLLAALVVPASVSAQHAQDPSHPTPASSTPQSHGPADAAHSNEHAGWISDRSDLTESASVVGAHALQLEIGFGFEQKATPEERERMFTGPMTLVRLGLGSRLELRAGSRGYAWEELTSHGHADRKSGRTDAEAGLKIQALTQQGAGVNVALIPAVSFPAGDGHFSTSGYDPSVTLAVSRHLSRGFGLIGNASVARPTDHGTRYYRRSVAAGLEHRLIPGMGGYIEVLGATSRDPHLENRWEQWLGGVGFTARPASWFELDFQGAWGLSDAAPDWGLGVGMTFRYGSSY